MAGKSASLHLSTHGQTPETLSNIIKNIVGRAGCDHCGLIAFMRLELSDPDPTLGKLGVVGAQFEGMK
jgi:hypothetical protein